MYMCIRAFVAEQESPAFLEALCLSSGEFRPYVTMHRGGGEPQQKDVPFVAPMFGEMQKTCHAAAPLG